MKRDALNQLLDDWLEPERFRDVAENGLQIEGKDDVHHVVCGVSANRALIETAIEKKADAVFVHHGIVWGGGIRRLNGWLKERVALLLANDISLFAHHLPLDAHPTLGNNAGLADALGFGSREPFGEYKGQLIGLAGELDDAVDFASFKSRISENVGAPVAAFGDDNQTIRKVGVCSGGAPDLLYEAIDKGYDCFVTGEVTEWVKAVSDESGVCFVAAGHHATERFGATRVAARLRDEAGLDATFVDVENPV